MTALNFPTSINVVFRESSVHAIVMIKTFQHKGLKAYFESGATKGIQAGHARRLSLILAALDIAATPGELNLPGYRLHPLKGQLVGYWSMTVSVLALIEN